MRAKDMFDFIDYKIHRDDEVSLIYKNEDKREKEEINKLHCYIEFSKGDCDVCCWLQNDEDEKASPMVINKQELKAIQKQVEELGW